jgi:hypothetical protein
MITVIRTATAFPGMTGEAISWAKEVAALVKRVTSKEQIVCSSFGGILAEIAWIAQYDSVGQYDEMRTKVVSDGDYRTALKKARDLFTPGSGRDQIWKHE